MQIRKLLIPTDFSDLSEHTLDYAIGLATALNASVELLHVHHVPALSLQDGDLRVCEKTVASEGRSRSGGARNPHVFQYTL
ncbi:MAG: universal stress protein, partial [Gammaproteobacteria bacterium]